MQGSYSAFFAYPSQPSSCGDAVRAAIEKLNGAAVLHVTGWEALHVGGAVVIDRVCKAIEASDLFLCDLTGANPNVLFELGYAIGRNKRVWIIRDTTLEEDQRHFDQLRTLTTIGYVGYTHSDHITASLYRDAPYEESRETLFATVVQPALRPNARPALLYLKAAQENEAGRRLTAQISSSGLPVVIDDPFETAVQTLAWYAEKVSGALGVVSHMVRTDRKGARVVNARHALVAGLALALNKPVLILNEDAGLLPPMDYRDLARAYTSADEAVGVAAPFLTTVRDTWRRLQAEVADYASHVKLAADLRGLYLGEHVAENEEQRLLDDYFIETSAFIEARSGQDMIFVGRKGSGKSANMLKLSSDLRGDKRNLVCVIKPVAYELQGAVDLLKRYREADIKGYVIESLWKFLIFVEIADTLAGELQARGAYSRTRPEEEFLAFVTDNAALLGGDFTVRLERCVSDLLRLSVDGAESRERQQLAISEALHRDILTGLRDAIAQAAPKRRICVLVDNLDKAWERGADLELLAQVILGLLRVTPRIPIEFRKPSGGAPSIQVNLAVFLRSDIFDLVRRVAREPDKIKFTRLTWSDGELLARVIEQRFAAAQDSVIDPAHLWSRYFRDVVGGQVTKRYILGRILPRPRDLVYFVKAAIATAVNRGHGMVDADDVMEAERQYSQYAFASVVAENGVEPVSLENILYEFAGTDAIVSRGEVEALLRKAGVADAALAGVVERLCTLSFLGVEVAPGGFRYAEDSLDFRVVRVRSDRYAEQVPKPDLRYEIHPAFRAFLEIGGPKPAQ